MATVYDLWDLETGNMIDRYATRDEALAAVRDLLVANAPSYVEFLSLGHRDERGGRGLVAEGPELEKLARLGGTGHDSKRSSDAVA